MSVREFLLPDLGEGLEDAEIVTWRVAAGDRVELNQTLVEVNTAKALVEIPSPWAGVVETLHGAEGDVVNVGSPLVAIRVEDEAARPEDEQSKRRPVLVGYGVSEDERPARRPRGEGSAAGSGSEAKEDVGRASGPVPASPPVRRLAKELGVDLAAVAGSGPGGRITREDVTAAARSQVAAAELRAAASEEQPERPASSRALTAVPSDGSEGAADIDRMPVRGVRRLIAEKMARAVREIPHVTTFLTVDATHLQALRRDLTSTGARRLSPLPIVARALAEICRDHPKLNASFDAAASEIVLYRRIHVGIATDTDQGLLVPVVRDAQALGIVAIAREIERLAESARAGSLTPQDMTGGTITVSNVGTFGAEFGTPIINPPEGAILALGVIQERALVVDGRVEARPAMTLSLSFDHRLLDGAEAGLGLRSLADLLENPFRLGALPR
jgi:pyruvate dehydrogenase E2 component (dihydrolipoamide acetyltransferase)